MQRKSCEICGYSSNPEGLVVHRIVPKEVARQAGILDLRSAVLCINCSKEVETWYSKRVFGLAYDAKTNRFVPKSSTDMVKEYEAAFKAFANYKKLL